ncbi:thioredoxin family protein [Orenia marismortui]|uniref:Thioredoxin-like protein n=1 Tax=Orenia marismortui TaxID=46469 RepID=A0A4R8GX02_9FIRM|nr:thioredoxin family protein [Orenia marismortui]TDX46793.1 thioredoxin-like protein [Orenia marismortui]
MLNLNDAISFNDFLNSSTNEYKEDQLRLCEDIQLSKSTKRKVLEVETKIDLIVFSEIYCPDCRIVMPFLQQLEEINNNIIIYIFPRKSYEELMKEYTATAKIPTILRFNSNNNSIGEFVEFPEKIKEEIRWATEGEKKDLINRYRRGEYNQLIEKEILERLIMNR